MMRHLFAFFLLLFTPFLGGTSGPSFSPEALLAAAHPHEAHLYRVGGHFLALVPDGPAPYLVLSDDWAPREGYQGISRLALWLGAGGDLVRLVLLESGETPSYVRRIRRSDFLSRLQAAMNQSPEPAGVDALTGATLSTRAMEQSARDTLGKLRPLLGHLQREGGRLTSSDPALKPEAISPQG